MIINKVLAEVPLKNIWIFVTDKCNLNCDYCFFKHRTNSRELSYAQISTLLSTLPRDKRHTIVVSGGEPLIVWDKVEYIFNRVFELFPRRDCSIQSNMYYWREEHIRFVLDNRICVEPGLDGELPSNQRHRLGITGTTYEVYKRNVAELIERGVDINPTMTVHPDEVDFMEENFFKLIEMGFYDIEVHPAFLAPWDHEKAEKFLERYRRLLTWELKSRSRRIKGEGFIGKMYSFSMGYGMDLVVQPDGKVLPNWTLLSFPEDIRDKFTLFYIEDDKIVINQQVLIDYLKKLLDFFKQNPTASYREFSNFNAELVVRYMDRDHNDWFQAYRYLTEEIVRIERKIPMANPRKGAL